MRISLLLQREPFGEILCRTLERFLDGPDDGKHSVSWHPRRPLFSRSRGGSQRWLCNRYLNAIFLPRPSRSDLEPIAREFSRSVSLRRRLLQRAYVGLATHSLGALLAADAYLEVSPPVRDAEHWLIVGGNHKLRILNRPAGKTIAVLKEGFDGNRFSNEISMQALAERAGLPVPPIGRVAEDGSWVEERYITGTPLNRLEDPREAAAAAAQIGRLLARFSLGSRQELAVADHIAPLLADCRKHVVENTRMEARHRDRIERDLQSLERRLAAYAQRQISTGPAHGDFQPANVLKTDETLWLIDWEFAGRRQLGGDGLVYALGVRHPTGLARRLRQFIAHPVQDPLLKGWPGASWEDRDDRELSVLILVLEELALWFEENDNPRFFAVDPSASVLVQEIERWLLPEEAPS